MRGRYVFFCSSLPKVKITGATMLRPKGSVVGMSALATSKAEGQRGRHVGLGDFLVEDVALRDVPARSAILPGPERRDPSLLLEKLVPGEVILLGARRGFRGADRLGQLGPGIGDEGAHLLAEGL